MKNQDILEDFVEFICKEIIDNNDYYINNEFNGAKTAKFADLPDFHQEEIKAKIKSKLTNNIINFIKNYDKS